MFENIRNEKAPQRIIGQIRSAILEGRLEPGEKLPGEQELTAHFGVSRQTLREALRALEILGLLEIRPGSGGGAFVSEVDLETAKDSLTNFLHFQNLSITHLSEIRKCLEPYAARLAAERMTEADLTRLREIQEKCQAILERRQFGELMVMGIAFHRTIAGTTRNPLLILILDLVENLLTDIKRVLRIDLGFSTRFLECHERIIQALTARDRERAEKEMLNDVTVVETELLRIAQDKSEIKWTWRRPGRTAGLEDAERP
jgi:GntR family transcriptional repressor for pyruvate dehydrogenase complex